MASSGHLRRCSDADTANQYVSHEKDTSILSWATSHVFFRFHTIISCCFSLCTALIYLTYVFCATKEVLEYFTALLFVVYLLVLCFSIYSNSRTLRVFLSQFVSFSPLLETPMGTDWERVFFFGLMGHRWEGVGTLVGNTPSPTELPRNSFEC